MGKEASRDSASYPTAFCQAYAELVVRAWREPAGGADSCRSRRRGPGDLEADEIDGIIQEAEWQGGPGKFGGLRESLSRKAKRDQENRQAIGGLRRPTLALERVPGLRAVGREISDLFDKFTENHTGADTVGADTVGEHYGTPDFSP